MSFAFDEMLQFAGEAWGQLGINTVRKWSQFNALYFENKLRPVPLVITNTQPYGRRIAFCSYAGPDRLGRTITLNVPKDNDVLLADNATLLHEMVHQLLYENGEDAAHDSEGWRREIMRIEKILGGDIWAGKYTTKWQRETKTVIRVNLAEPGTGRPSLTQSQIARWPHAHDMGELGFHRQH